MTPGPHILNGKEIAEKHLQRLSREITAVQKTGHSLTLATIQAGNNHDATLYSQAIDKLMKKVGVRYTPHNFPGQISENHLLAELDKLNRDPQITGIMIFSPLPEHVHAHNVLNAIELSKDVEGRRVIYSARNGVLSPTALACQTLIEETGCDIAGKEAVVVGCSEIVGKPSAIWLVDKRATVTVCHSKTKNLRAHVENADILIATAGRPHLIKGEWIKPGAIVIDVGENVVEGHLVGDVEFETAKARAGFISPVPGGVGPLTNAMLVKNLISLWKSRN